MARGSSEMVLGEHGARSGLAVVSPSPPPSPTHAPSRPIDSRISHELRTFIFATALLGVLWGAKVLSSFYPSLVQTRAVSAPMSGRPPLAFFE